MKLRTYLWPGKPRLIGFQYSQVIVADQPYLLFSWSYQGAAYLHLKTLGFKTHHMAGSAYVSLPGSLDRIQLILGNFWRKVRLEIALVSLNAGQLTIRLEKNFSELTGMQPYRPNIQLSGNLSFKPLPGIQIIQPQFPD